ncbi:uncharacterized protein LOC112090643 [Morus notabilis]|uniref:uncharacterized protein LOC112090643 n=1 Tax=Morus notabilis TaxID=981085 RepID=UPI000CED4291|nr:uncharacterized protein LOC112090643 [Morus notabilis]
MRFKMFGPSSSTVATPRQKSLFYDETELVPLAILHPLEIIPFVTPPESGIHEEVFSTPRGSSNSDDSTVPAPVSLPPVDTPVDVGTSQPSPGSSPRIPPNLMKFPIIPGFPSWTNRFPVYPEGMKQKSQTCIETEIRAQSKKPKKKRSASSSDTAFHPSATYAAPDEAESSQPSTDPLPKRKNQKKKKKPPHPPVNSCRVTRSKAKSQAKAPETLKREKEKKSSAPSSGKDDTILFYSDLNKNVWKSVIKRKIFSERLLNESKFGELGVLELLKDRSLLGTVTKIKPFVNDVILEFYANLVSGVNDHKSPMFHKVFVIGHLFHFSPAIINDFYGSHRTIVECEASYNQIITELTGNVRCNWPALKSFPAAELSLKYSVLHKIALKNWMPSTHSTGVNKPLAKLLYMIGLCFSFDIRQLIYDQIVSNAKVLFTHQVLPFPSLIYGVLMSQNDIKKSVEVFAKLPGELRISKKFHSGKHMDDVQGESFSVFEDELQEDATPHVSTGVTSSSSQPAATVQKTQTIQYLQKELQVLVACEKRLLQELKEIDQRKRETAALLEDLQPSSAADGVGTSS